MAYYSPNLVAAARQGDRAALADLLALAQPDIRRYARRSCRSLGDAEEATQETLLVLYRRVAALREVGRLSSWLFTVVRRHCLKLSRRLVGVTVDAQAVAEDSRLASRPTAELRIDLAHALQSLPARYREVVLLRDVEELTIDEIAGRLGLTREAAKGRLHRARQMVREYLAG